MTMQSNQEQGTNLVLYLVASLSDTEPKKISSSESSCSTESTKSGVLYNHFIDAYKPVLEIYFYLTPLIWDAVFLALNDYRSQV